MQWTATSLPGMGFGEMSGKGAHGVRSRPGGMIHRSRAIDWPRSSDDRLKRGPIMTEFEKELEERLLRYVRIDTQSDETSSSLPSSDRQLELLRLLEDELRGIGAEDVRLTGYGVVLATIPATVTTPVATIGWLAHVDTSPGCSGAGVKPVVYRSYDGGAISFPDAPGLVLSPEQYPYLGTKAGEDIITASGTTVLGADDKAGVAIIMTAARHLLENPRIAHGPIRIGFNPDEEIARGIHPDLPADLGAVVCYTIDGAGKGEIVGETFSADKAVVTVKGVPVHTAIAKGKMVNALSLAARIIGSLPQDTLTPETTEGREGFIHLLQLSGSPVDAELHFLLRDFEPDGLAAHGALLAQVCAEVQAAEPRAEITCTITPQYRNMRYLLEKDMRPVELAHEACRQIGVTPASTRFRGATDGTFLGEMGVPAPNLFTGMQEFHGTLEWISVQDMAAATRMCIRLAELWAEGPASAVTPPAG
jgi:tripeptide aminopeptidase